MHRVAPHEEAGRGNGDSAVRIDLSRDVRRAIAALLVDVRAQSNAALGVALLEDRVLSLGGHLQHERVGAPRVDLGFGGMVGERNPLPAAGRNDEEGTQARNDE